MRKLTGMRRYKFEEADGWPEHSLSDTSLKFMTQYQFLTMARFRQHVDGNQQRLTEMPEGVIGITKIRILKVPALEQSLYMAIIDEGLAVPVAYAMYSKPGLLAGRRRTGMALSRMRPIPPPLYDSGPNKTLFPELQCRIEVHS